MTNRSFPTCPPTPATRSAAIGFRPGNTRAITRIAALAALVAALLTALVLPSTASTGPAAAAPAVAKPASLGGAVTHIVSVSGAGSSSQATGRTSTGQATPTTRPRNSAARPTDASGPLAFAALCVAGMVLVAGGVLFYTAKTRRSVSPNSDRSR